MAVMATNMRSFDEDAWETSVCLLELYCRAVEDVRARIEVASKQAEESEDESYFDIRKDVCSKGVLVREVPHRDVMRTLAGVAADNRRPAVFFLESCPIKCPLRRMVVQPFLGRQVGDT